MEFFEPFVLILGSPFVLPFQAIIIAIMANSILRCVRRVDELQSRRSLFTFPAPARRPSDDFHDEVWLPLCQSVAGMAASKLLRAVTAQERRIIWRCRTPRILEATLKQIALACRAEEISALLANLSSGLVRPDPTGWCQEGPNP